MPIEIGLDGGDHAGAIETGEVGRYCVVVLFDEQRFRRRVEPIIAEHIPDQIDQRRFAVTAALSIDEEENPYLDLYWPFRRSYDRRTSRIMIRDFRRHYFGKNKRLTKERCETFFSNRRNFIGA
ncbi:MAG: hypothetical protein ACLPX7_12620 [Xanthobacteraceae bacterium]